MTLTWVGSPVLVPGIGRLRNTKIIGNQIHNSLAVNFFWRFHCEFVPCDMFVVRKIFSGIKLLKQRLIPSSFLYISVF